MKGFGLDKLEEAILLQAAMMDLKADVSGLGEAVRLPMTLFVLVPVPIAVADLHAQVILESKVDRGRGIVATGLVRAGILRVGDFFVAGTAWGKVRALVTEGSTFLLTCLLLEVISLSADTV